MCKRHELIGLNALVGQTMTSVTGVEQGEEMIFVCENGTKFVFYHQQDCCENVAIDDIAGDLNDLVGSPIHAAEVVTDGSDDAEDEPDDGHFTWTFYKFATIKGSVTVRWYGTSNGYYSEEVNLRIE